ncbi:ABC transporter substrate-binding protein [Verminephrobacter aporrectodeae subsp. tuberculatae]|uniref:transporter substrate-binding domain-containing protein n=1 Tax=Verminephrobacter aporrectodeae TaxID=1110389 RepID=UPI00223810DD|nr:transporter substrate-binding domain-containing protein [Verminephrobacter aporrectodeae]MCW5222959.1 ABC transporter substrate-binding protein [Verminephrobacter aporrectodeae subsp. tuberculatae]MCW5288423.1 ABC transporter substrate-binding protein [Verminephrobacter aporrectodeae subsp. tuberculatae]
MTNCRIVLTQLSLVAAGLLMAASAQAQNLLEGVQAKKEIVVGTEAQFAPFEFVQDGKIVGYGPDLMHHVLAGLPGVKVKQLDVPFQGILPGLATRRFDFIITSVSVIKERADKFAFTIPIADATTALVRRKTDAALAVPAAVAGKTVGSAQLKALQAYAAQLKAEGKPAINIREYVSFDEAYADLAAGRLDAVAQSLANLATLVKTRGDTYALVPGPIGPKSYFAWVGRKDADSAPLVAYFNKGIAEAQRSGKMTELQQKWFGFTMQTPTDKLPEPTM